MMRISGKVRYLLAVLLTTFVLAGIMPAQLRAAEHVSPTTENAPVLYLNFDFGTDMCDKAYDIELSLDDKVIGTAEFGKHYFMSFEGLEEGEHTVTFVSADNEEIGYYKTIDVKGTAVMSCFFATLENDIEFYNVVESGEADVYTTSSDLNIRRDPDGLGEVLETVDAGEDLYVLDVKDGWATVLTDEGLAYASAEYLAEAGSDGTRALAGAAAGAGAAGAAGGAFAGDSSASEDVGTRSSEPMVWIPRTGSKYHSKPGCSGMENPSEVTLSEAESMGYEPCKRCH